MAEDRLGRPFVIEDQKGSGYTGRPKKMWRDSVEWTGCKPGGGGGDDEGYGEEEEEEVI